MNCATTIFIVQLTNKERGNRIEANRRWRFLLTPQLMPLFVPPSIHPPYNLVVVVMSYHICLLLGPHGRRIELCATDDKLDVVAHFH